MSESNLDVQAIGDCPNPTLDNFMLCANKYGNYLTKSPR